MTVEIEGLERTMRLLQEQTENAVGLSILEIEGRLREETPIDTGFARNSWYTTNREDDEGTPGANPTAEQQGIDKQYKLSEVLYINNGAQYIGVLEDGHSQQAPQGMVSVVLPEVPGIVDKAVRATKR